MNPAEIEQRRFVPPLKPEIEEKLGNIKYGEFFESDRVPEDSYIPIKNREMIKNNNDAFKEF